ncbi:hypothetical protein [Sphaerisporangium perillae]|uniref:hypothetical protein n=1 Tax=Sphaerisporangium perillae TaxID=2935860 RepID=UPI00200F8791|nr:hypothetical protein [Sphaerisporangium perillae]
MNVRHSVLILFAAGLVSSCGGVPPAAVPPTTAPATPLVHLTESNPPGDIPDDTVYVVYRHPGRPYELKVPEGWARTDLPTGAGFTDKLNSVRVEIGAPADPPGAEIRKRATVNRKGGKAELTVYRIDSAPDPVTGKVIRDEVERYVFSRNGRQAVLTLTGPVGADNVDPWRTVSDSLRWLS